ncbi:MAG: HU family DNA-binding protein [Patescibacteria group bacterium]
MAQSTTKVTKTDFIKDFADTNGISQNEASKYLESFLDLISTNLKKGNEITFTGFGTFKTSKRNARKGRNPQTGAEIDIPESTVVNFKAGKGLKDLVS